MIFPHYRQLDQMDCGPTCLRMIAKHYGRSFTAQGLREQAKIGKDGVSLLGIAEAAEAIGFRTMGTKVSFAQLADEAPLPCIVHWQQNHFVVVYDIRSPHGWMNKLKGGRQAPGSLIEPTTQDTHQPGLHTLTATHQRSTVCVADPARGLLTYTADEFCQGWLSTQKGSRPEGIALLLEPTPDFYTQPDDDQSPAAGMGFGRVLPYVFQYKPLLIQLLLGLLVGSGLQLLFPFVTQSIVDVGIQTRNLPFVYLMLGAQLMLMAGRQGFLIKLGR